MILKEPISTHGNLLFLAVACCETDYSQYEIKISGFIVEIQDCMTLLTSDTLFPSQVCIFKRTSMQMDQLIQSGPGWPHSCSPLSG